MEDVGIQYWHACNVYRGDRNLMLHTSLAVFLSRLMRVSMSLC
jgi:hypothetical protein